MRCCALPPAAARCPDLRVFPPRSTFHRVCSSSSPSLTLSLPAPATPPCYPIPAAPSTACGPSSSLSSTSWQSCCGAGTPQRWAAMGGVAGAVEAVLAGCCCAGLGHTLSCCCCASGSVLTKHQGCSAERLLLRTVLRGAGPCLPVAAGAGGGRLDAARSV